MALHTPHLIEIKNGGTEFSTTVKLNPDGDSSGIKIEVNPDNDSSFYVKRWNGDFELWGDIDDCHEDSPFVSKIQMNNKVVENLLTLVQKFISTLADDYPSETRAVASSIQKYVDLCGGDELWMTTQGKPLNL